MLMLSKLTTKYPNLFNFTCPWIVHISSAAVNINPVVELNNPFVIV